MAHKIHLYTHSFNFFSYCLFAPIPASMYPSYAIAFFRTLSLHPCQFLSCALGSEHARALIRSFFPVGYFASCNFVCTITFNSFLFSLLFFSFHFSGQYGLAFATYHFLLSLCSLHIASAPILIFCLFALRFQEIYRETFRFFSLFRLPFCCFRFHSNRKMFAHFSFLAYHLRAENKNAKRK